MADDEPVWEAYRSGGHRPRLAVDNASPLVLRAAKLPGPTTIPPRQWLYGTQLLRGFVTVLVAPGGTGKSTYAMVVATALACGRKLLGEHIFASVRTAILNLEDPMEELDRRLAAIMIRHEVTTEEIEGRIFLHSGEDRPVTMAAIGDDGFTVIHPDEEALTNEILAHDIGVLFVDPFAESHTLEENNNPQMIQAAAAWRRIARATNCAVLLVHHVRKGIVTDIDSARGAKGLTDSARVGLLLSPMGQEDGEALGITAEERWQYVRLDDAKVNMAPKATKARWFKLEREHLHNGTVDYPSGDHVAAIVAWEAPSPFEDFSIKAVVNVLDRLRQGPGAGEQFCLRGGSETRWAGTVIMAETGKTKEQAARVLSLWTKSGLIIATRYHSKADRKERSGIEVDEAKLQELRQADAPIFPE